MNNFDWMSDIKIFTDFNNVSHFSVKSMFTCKKGKLDVLKIIANMAHTAIHWLKKQPSQTKLWNSSVHGTERKGKLFLPNCTVVLV